MSTTKVFVITQKERRPRDQARVEQRFATGLCLNKFLVKPGSCESIDCPRTQKRRGNCIACMTALDRQLKSMDPQTAIEHEQDMIQRGLILREQECRQLKQTNCMKIRTA